jgi:hypothetical protein
MPPKGKRGGKSGGSKAAPKKDEGKQNKVQVKESYRSATGVLISRPRALDVKIGGFTLSAWGKELIKDTQIELTIGRRYGLIGHNGSGKFRMFIFSSTLNHLIIFSLFSLFVIREIFFSQVSCSSRSSNS